MLSSFAGRTALIIHQADHHRGALEAQIHRIGLTFRAQSPATTMTLEDAAVDFIFFDADTGHESLFPWGRAFPPVPLIALLASEAPGRIEWALSQHASGFIVKPIGSGRVFQTLLVAHQVHAEMKRLRDTVDDLAERVRARPLVVRATIEIMRLHGLDEVHALDRLRRAAMDARVSVESLAAGIASQPALAARLGDTPDTVSIAAPKGRRATT
ncbi:MAG TPA: ANTAR domain-containing protein [Acidisoma sp.]|jgi:response regulator NasT|uniref:ANTAR domain-containing response regulator n=1 Tax=Acidisoma sp. TaxID=1872115 RepID=UPI002C81B80E|nr:ANTAR domain-containing protein [Acidisoma sp.]HTI00537.1 ANTAR domain-containing protein [Acidisoma sp.]